MIKRHTRLPCSSFLMMRSFHVTIHIQGLQEQNQTRKHISLSNHYSRWTLQQIDNSFAEIKVYCLANVPSFNCSNHSTYSKRKKQKILTASSPCWIMACSQYDSLKVYGFSSILENPDDESKTCIEWDNWDTSYNLQAIYIDLSDAKSSRLRKNWWGYMGGCSASAWEGKIQKIGYTICSICLKTRNLFKTEEY